MIKSKENSSFRDPSGFLFYQDGNLFRQVNQEYADHYDHLCQSGLYKELTRKGLLLPHQEVDLQPPAPEICYKIIQPERIALISYPYEWCFSQYVDAALLTLAIMKTAIDHGMVLKDASAYNIQFHQGKPVLIDTLSFEIYQEGLPWVAYRQFCQHFLAPLALMAHKDVRLNKLMQVFIDGIPLDLASELLPWKTRANLGLLSHIHLHAAAQKRFSDKPVHTERSTGKVSKLSLLGLIDSLETTIIKMKWQPEGTEWGEYYDDTNYTRNAFEHKKHLVSDFIDQAHPNLVWDLGANTGVFSQIACNKGILTAAFDIDPAAVEKNYRQSKQNKVTHMLPLVMDLTNPSSGIGWSHQERKSLAERGPADLIMALALVHHLAISNNVPFEMISSFFSSLGRWLIVEFIPKEDSQVQRLLKSRKDIFTGYSRNTFEATFERDFTIHRVEAIPDSQRILYLMEGKSLPG